MVQGNTCVTTVHCGQSDGRPGGQGPAGAGLVVDRNWRDLAACRSADPELFFPVGDDGPALVQIAAAKAVCAGCPVVAECLSFALVAVPEGVAGGLTVEERRGLRGQRRRVSGPTVAGAAGHSGRVPAGVDELVVTRLVAGEGVAGATRQELAHAAVALHLAGHGCGWIGTRLGVGDRQVYRWVARHRAGTPLVLTEGRVGGRQSPSVDSLCAGARARTRSCGRHGGTR
jgi:WhiB family transcriptional regulator, redox-sensing transcriptional regulator